MGVTRTLRLGVPCLCLMYLLSGCGTLRSLLSPPPVAPVQVCPTMPKALTEPVSVPAVCHVVSDGESLMDCSESALMALGACNAQLKQIEQQMSEKDRVP